MTKKQKALVVLWAMTLAAILVYPPWFYVQGKSSQGYIPMGHHHLVTERRDHRLNKLDKDTLVLELGAVTLFFGALFTMTLPRAKEVDQLSDTEAETFKQALTA
jgi:hypothetical protein